MTNPHNKPILKNNHMQKQLQYFKALFSIPNLVLIVFLAISFAYAIITKNNSKIANNIQYSTLFYDNFCNFPATNFSGYKCYDKANLATGLVTGMANFSQEFKDQFISLGLIHLIVASGSQISLIKSVIDWSLIRIGVFPKSRLAALIVAVVLYLFYLGVTPPMIRALFFIVLFQIINTVLGIRISSIRCLLYSYGIIIFFFPFWFSSISLLLSMSATTGILVNNYLFKDFKYSVISEQIIITLLILPVISQISTKFNLVSLPLNIILGYLIPYIMVVIIAGTVLSVFNLYNYLFTFMMDILLLVISYVDRLTVGWSVISLPKFSIINSAIYYLLVLLPLLVLYAKDNIETVNLTDSSLIIK